ncbi:MAG: MarR family winged helix-turn-helix transcriptional regulator [Gammaproteobacteria bacterium]|nr:MAG: MarR family winged helix-turn-helix transcriptional regulator [Gammaproteobacteria bacterium]
MLRENLERNFGFILHDVARLLRTTYDRRVRDLGLTRSQWWVLTHLFRKDGITQSELAEMLELEKPSLGRLLDRLEAKGWVRRAADARDRRAKRVYLTDAAQAPMRVMREIAAGVREDALSGLNAADRERFVDTLLAVKSNLMGQVNGASKGNGRGGR